jgi:hypothetical protein
MAPELAGQFQRPALGQSRIAIGDDEGVGLQARR